MVCHGKSEVRIVENLRRNLKIPIAILSEKNGKNSIQIGKSLDRFLHKKLNKKKAVNDLGIIEYDKKGQPLDLKIFILMDLDDVQEHQMIENYKNGTLFSKHKFSNLIIPLYNDGNLEEVMLRMGYDTPNDKREKVMVYDRLFSAQNISENLTSIEKFMEDCKKCKQTNMELLLQHVIEHAKSVGNF
ncbi:hypothetical protein RR47_GL001643 [Enterococcus columbae DSM 7374 = ATCC 51263]|nr:hypothetical protein RR47_GL001643 [Enterococcus columbae DSM 7374 = ATCC 51263]